MRLPGGASLALLLARRSLSSSPAASSLSSSIHATRANRGTRPVVARDYFDVLDVKKDAGQGEIKKAYYASQHDEFEAKFFEERAPLESKYQKMYEPLYSKRHDVVNGVVEVEGVTKDDSGEAAADQKAKYMHSRLFAIVVIYVKYKAKCEAMKRINKE
ncbi:Nucleosome assembly protein 1-like protein 1 [Hordeum vulgare]|nr:Nucleosome assembly protein 1-like protein 1 [Hordeum vulgare]